MTEKNIIEIIPKELVTNLLGPTTKSIGEGLGGVFNFITLPLRKLNVLSEKSYEDFTTKINSKTDDIPMEHRDNSKMNLAVKTTEDSIYQLDDELLREYFANLISNTLDNRKNNIITPRFSSVLSQLSSNDANMLKKMSESAWLFPSIDVRFQNKHTANGFNPFSPFLLYSDNNFEQGGASLDTLVSLGIMKVEKIELVATHFSKQYEDFENNFESHEDYERFIKGYPDFEYSPVNEDIEIKFSRHHVKLTSFGKDFCSIIL